MIHLAKRFVLLITILSLGLMCSCANNSSETISASISTTTQETSKPSANSIHTLDNILEKIKAGYNDPNIKVINTTKIGTDWSLVEYKPQGYNEFLIYNTKTGSYNVLARDAKFLKAEDENHLYFEIIGDWNEGGFLSFPYIEEYIRKAVSVEGQDAFYIAHPSEFYELSRSVKGGTKESDKLSAIIATFDSIEFLFKPADGPVGGAFYAAASYIPPTVTSYDKSTNEFTVEMDKCQLDSSIETNTEIKTTDNAYMATYKVNQKDDDIYITFTLRTSAAGYTMGGGKVPGDQPYDGYPYLSVQFADADIMTENQY